jgi:hypothetical protein
MKRQLVGRLHNDQLSEAGGGFEKESKEMELDNNLPVDADRLTLHATGVYRSMALQQDESGKWGRSKTEQRTTRDGVPIWEVVCQRLMAGGRTAVMRVSVAAEEEPQLMSMQPITFDGLRVSKFYVKKSGAVAAEFAAAAVRITEFEARPLGQRRQAVADAKRA